MAHCKPDGYSVGVLIVSDSVSKGEKEDRSGKNLEVLLNSGKHFNANLVANDCVADDKNKIVNVLKMWADEKGCDLILTVGGTGFSSRDVTPEATKAVIDKEASHLATYMIMRCSEKNKFSVLCRSVCGIRGNCLILNLPGSKKGSEECFEMIASVLPHALNHLKGDIKKIAAEHVEIQGEVDDRECSKSK